MRMLDNDVEPLVWGKASTPEPAKPANSPISGTPSYLLQMAGAPGPLSSPHQTPAGQPPETPTATRAHRATVPVSTNSEQYYRDAVDALLYAHAICVGRRILAIDLNLALARALTQLATFRHPADRAASDNDERVSLESARATVATAGLETTAIDLAIAQLSLAHRLDDEAADETRPPPACGEAQIVLAGGSSKVTVRDGTRIVIA